MDDVNISSNRSFGIVFFVIFLLIAIYPLTNGGDIRIWSGIISFIFLVLGLLNSSILTPLNKIWFKFGIILGKIISPVIMAIIFFNEQFNFYHFLGATLIVLGLFLSNKEIKNA